MNSNELKYWLAFSKMPEIGAVKFKRLIAFFENLEQAWKARVPELIKAGIEEKYAYIIIDKRNIIDPDIELEKIQKQNISVITIKNKNYPEPLAEIYNPPALFYFKGNIDILNQPCLSVVGTRKITDYGKRITSDLVSVLANNGLTIISGLALGIDALAHKTTIESCGKTAAILGSGVNNIYPLANTNLAEKILESDGCIISEYPLGMMALKHHFPVRNRIISGLSMGTLVIEAGKKSGALITAKYALDQNRQVFTVPGNIYNQSSVGPNNLIKMGAVPVTCANDILDALNIEMVHHQKISQEIIGDTKEEKIMIKHLSTEPISIDELVKLTSIDIQILNSSLTMMEMKGIVKNLGGQNYILNQ